LLTDSFVLTGRPGRRKKEGGSSLENARLYIPQLADADAAIRWVAQMSDKSRDPAIKHNARKPSNPEESIAWEAVPSHAVGVAEESPSKSPNDSFIWKAAYCRINGVS